MRKTEMQEQRAGNMINQNLYSEISRLIQEARSRVVQSVNWTMVTTYWEIGRRIIEEEQGGIR